MLWFDLKEFVVSCILLPIDVNESPFHDSDFTIVRTISGNNTPLLLSYRIFSKQAARRFFLLIRYFSI